MASLEGGCACGNITYKSHEPAQHLDYCYCTICQRISGSPFMVFVGIRKDALTWHGEVSEYRGTSIAKRPFCNKCGGALGMEYDCYPNKIHIAVGTIKKTNSELPKAGTHIWIKSKPSWYSIPNDGVPRHDEFDDSFVQTLTAWSEQCRSKQ